MRLTDDIIRRQSCPTGKAQHFIWDDLVAGYGVRLTPHAKAYVIQWREGGRKVRTTFAVPLDNGQAQRRWRQLSAPEARAEAQKLLLDKVTTTDGGQPLAKAMRQWAEAGKADWSPRFADKVTRIVEVWITGEPLKRGTKSPAEERAIRELGRKTVASVKRADMLTLLDAMKASDRMAVGQEVFAIVCMFYNWAIEREIATHNPAINRLKLVGGRRVRKRFLTDAELVTVWHAFASEGYPAFPAFQLLVYTGARRKEVTHATWAEFDLKAGTWTIPAERSKNRLAHTIALSPQALALVKAQPRTSDDHVFIGARDGRVFDFHHALVDRIRQRTPDLGDWRLHDLRRTMRTGLARLGVSQVVAEMCLNHVTVKTGLVGVYDAYDYRDDCAKAWKKWGAHVAKLLSTTRTKAA